MQLLLPASLRAGLRGSVLGANAARRFRRDEGGGMIVFGVMIFGLMLAIGGISFDIMRYETHRDRLQATLDRAVLAAASLKQERDPKAVVLDYMAKAGMSEFISAEDIKVTPGFGSRRVEATAKMYVPLHHGVFNLANSDRVDTLVADARSAAEEGIGDVEISMVLDVYWSMNSGNHNGQNRLENLKDAAQGFLDTVYDNATGDSVITTSVIPYSTQVAANEQLLSYFNRSDRHEFSYCLNFSDTDFTSAGMTPVDANGVGPSYTQALHMDPWTHEGWWGYWEVGEELPAPNCPTDPSLEILPWSTNKEAIKTYIEGFEPQYNTSTDLGAKWGAALLDPALQPVVTGMIGTGHVPGDAAGRPHSYGESLAMKVLVVMTDGVNTNQYTMDNYRTGDSFVWRFTEGDDVYYSIWPDGEGSQPDLTYETEEVFSHEEWVGREYVGRECVSGYYSHYYRRYICTRHRDVYRDVYEDVYVTQPVMKWWTVYNTNFDGNGSTQYMWTPVPFDRNMADGQIDAERMTWDEVWQAFPPEYFSDRTLWDMINDAPSDMNVMSSNERNAFEWSIGAVNGGTKNTRLENVCKAARDQGVIVFTVGMEVTESSAQLLTRCASSPSHYFSAETINIDAAFQQIAAQINQLRLIQ
jgi:hypothetical protein